MPSAALTTVTAFISICIPSSSLAADGLYICAEHADPDDWEAEFAHGPVLVPAGTVFDYAVISSGALSRTPKIARTSIKGWKGVTSEENQKRSKLVAQDMSTDKRRSSAAVTTKHVNLTKDVPCALAPARTVLSKEWDGIFHLYLATRASTIKHLE